MITSRSVHWLAEVLGFLVFAAALYAPQLAETAGAATVDARVLGLLQEALAKPAVQRALALNLLGHLLPLAVVYGLLRVLGGALACRFGSPAVAPLVMVAGWLVLVAGNAWLFPLSNHAYFFSSLNRLWLAPLLATLLVLGVLLTLGRWGRIALPGFLALAVAGLALTAWPDRGRPGAGARHVILLGIDSISPMVLEAERQHLPQMAALMGQAQVFERAYTPLARTFPAWVSILSGASPAEHGALFNLRNLDGVQRDGLLTQVLAGHGMRPVWAIDERRFSNMDRSFGFDAVVGPSAGALDFLLQRANDAPLTNLMLQHRWTRALLPYSALNTASYANYDDVGFVDAILSQLRAQPGPVFLAAHFESAHFPFHTRHAQRALTRDHSLEARHVEALEVVDAQLARLLDGLRAGGYLDDALVIVLSDHGESLGQLELQTTRGGEVLELRSSGHGTELLSELQNRVLFGTLRFRDGAPIDPPARHTDRMVSLTDVRGIVESFAATGAPVLPDAGRCMTVETGLRLSAAASYKTLDPALVAAQGAGFYEIDAVGRMRLKESVLPDLVAGKDVGWRCLDRLTYYRAADQRHYAYRIEDHGRALVETAPNAQDIARVDAYRQRLADAVR